MKSLGPGFQPFLDTHNPRVSSQTHIWKQQVYFHPISIPIKLDGDQNQRQNNLIFKSQRHNTRVLSIVSNQVQLAQGVQVQRKKRTYISQQILDIMFDKFEEREITKKSIKDIANELNIDYRTVYQRYQYFWEQKKKNQGGPIHFKSKKTIREKNEQLIKILLMISEKQQIEQTSIPSLSDLIKVKYGKVFPHFAISKYWKIVKEEKQKALNLISINEQSHNWQEYIVKSFQGFAKNGVQMLFLTIYCFQTADHKMMMLMVLSSDDGLIFKFQQKKVNDVEKQIKYVLFRDVLNFYQAEYGLKERWVIIARDEDIYESKGGEVVIREKEQKMFSNIILIRGGLFFCLPPKYGFFSFGTNYKPVAPKDQLLSLEQMYQQMLYFKNHYPYSQGSKNVSNQSKSQVSCEESNDMD